MHKETKIISLSLPFRMGSVNCYLIETDSGYVLIDTGIHIAAKSLSGNLKALAVSPDCSS